MEIFDGDTRNLKGHDMQKAVYPYLQSIVKEGKLKPFTMQSDCIAGVLDKTSGRINPTTLT